MLLTVSDVTKIYPSAGGEIAVLNGVSLELHAGETLALTGESGSGKSTLLHLIGGLDTPNAGTINVAGTEISNLDDTGRAALRRGTVGVVFQQFNLIPSLTVGANIAFQARLAGKHDPARAADITQRLGLSDQLDKYPEALSGGQQQRVAIARTLAAQPQLILADEPTGNLDEANADIVLDLLRDIAKEAGAALLMVTHSVSHAAKLDRRLHLSRGKIAS
jgi:putative ABC transport system ATP-binding protein